MFVTCLSFLIFLYLSRLCVFLFGDSFVNLSSPFSMCFSALCFSPVHFSSLSCPSVSLLLLSFLCLSLVCLRVFSVGIFSSSFLFSVSIDRFLFNSCIPPVYFSSPYISSVSSSSFRLFILSLSSLCLLSVCLSFVYLFFVSVSSFLSEFLCLFPVFPTSNFTLSTVFPLCVSSLYVYLLSISSLLVYRNFCLHFCISFSSFPCLTSLSLSF